MPGVQFNFSSNIFGISCQIGVLLCASQITTNAYAVAGVLCYCIAI